MAWQLRITRVISAIFLRDTLEAASNDAEMLVQEMPDLVCIGSCNVAFPIPEANIFDWL